MELCGKNEENPWMVEELEEFLYYCCPECDEKCRARGPFLQHALCNHPNVRNVKVALCQKNLEDIWFYNSSKKTILNYNFQYMALTKYW